MTNVHEQAGVLDARVKGDIRHAPFGSLMWHLGADLPSLGYYVREQLAGDGSPVATVALLDWTTVNHVHRLINGDRDGIDPFVALADLNALLAAVLFYDRVMVVDGDGVYEDVGEELGVADVLYSLSTRGGPQTPWNVSVLTDSCESCFQDAAANMANLRPDSPLKVELDNAWTELLPAAELPEDRDPNAIHWTGSPGRPVLFRQLFGPTDLWGDPRFTKRLIVDNDIRALTYENVASVLTGALATDELVGPNVRYVGGVLRSPMQRAARAMWRRSWDRRGGLPLETALNERWAAHVATRAASPAFPQDWRLRARRPSFPTLRRPCSTVKSSVC